MNVEGVALYFLSPLCTTLLLWLSAGAGWAFGWRRLGLVLASAGFVLLSVCSTPWVADRLQSDLEGRFRAFSPQAAPVADAIVVLGGAVAGPRPPERPNLILGPASSRVWHAAALYRAGKARWVVVAAGNRPEQATEQVEAEVIGQILFQLGVPRSAIVLEGESRTTRENARNVRPILDRLGVRRVLLVTSAQHMPRALQTFTKVWGPGGPQLIPAVTDVRGRAEPLNGAEVWLPSLDALLSVTKSLKEFAGMAALAIIQ
jgi:uncharacterized SAM-binding protein YcdF (DUF218 family)